MDQPECITDLLSKGHPAMNNEAITSVMTGGGSVRYGFGVYPNPFSKQQKEWERRRATRESRGLITEKIESLFEPRFITPPETSELVEAIVTATDSRRILELGTCTGFTTLHILRAILGKPDAKVFSVDARPAHDQEFWNRNDWADHIAFIEGWTPEVLKRFHGMTFDLVFVDSDHSVDHTVKELGELWNITRKGTVFLFHDVPEWQSPDIRFPVPIRSYLTGKVLDGTFEGGVIPTCEQLDCLAVWGEGYPPQCNPGLGVFVRK